MNILKPRVSVLMTVYNAEKYLLAVIYKDDGGMDMLPCFTETMKLDENIANAKKRFLQV